MSTKQRRLSAFFKNVNGKWKEEEEEEEKTELGHLINFLFFHLYINRSIDFFFSFYDFLLFSFVIIC
jgi:hypothetical protein